MENISVLQIALIGIILLLLLAERFAIAQGIFVKVEYSKEKRKVYAIGVGSMLVLAGASSGDDLVVFVGMMVGILLYRKTHGYGLKKKS